MHARGIGSNSGCKDPVYCPTSAKVSEWFFHPCAGMVVPSFLDRCANLVAHPHARGCGWLQLRAERDRCAGTHSGCVSRTHRRRPPRIRRIRASDLPACVAVSVRSGSGAMALCGASIGLPGECDGERAKSSTKVKRLHVPLSYAAGTSSSRLLLPRSWTPRSRLCWDQRRW